MQNLLFILLALLLPLSVDSAEWRGKTPSEALAPDQVIEIVIEALRDNGASEADEGIATVFRFASPQNRAVTGPLTRFTQMIKLGFRDMLDHVSHRTGELKIEGDVAVQPVWLITSHGVETGYLFQMGRQAVGEYKGMWMTDAVFPLGTNGQSI